MRPPEALAKICPAFSIMEMPWRIQHMCRCFSVHERPLGPLRQTHLPFRVFLDGRLSRACLHHSSFSRRGWSQHGRAVRYEVPCVTKDGSDSIPQRIAWYTGQLCCTALTCALTSVTDISESAYVSGMRNRQKPPHGRTPGFAFANDLKGNSRQRSV